MFDVTSEAMLDELFTLRIPAPEAGEDMPFGTCLPDLYSALGGRVIFAKYAGSIGLPCIQHFTPSLQDILTGDVEQIIISLEHVTKLSRTAVGVLVSFAAEVLGRGKELYLYKPAPVIENRLQTLNITGFFQFLKTDDDLISILRVA